MILRLLGFSISKIEWFRYAENKKPLAKWNESQIWKTNNYDDGAMEKCVNGIERTSKQAERVLVQWALTYIHTMACVYPHKISMEPNEIELKHCFDNIIFFSFAIFAFMLWVRMCKANTNRIEAKRTARALRAHIVSFWAFVFYARGL